MNDKEIEAMAKNVGRVLNIPWREALGDTWEYWERAQAKPNKVSYIANKVRLRRYRQNKNHYYLPLTRDVEDPHRTPTAEWENIEYMIADLTDKEKELASLLCNNSLKKSAEIMGVSIPTATKIRNSIRDKIRLDYLL